MPNPPEKQTNERPDLAGIPLMPQSQGIVFFIIIFATLYVARGFLLPVFAALLLSYALVPVVRMLIKLRIPRVLAAFMIIAFTSATLAYCVIALSGPAVTWLEKAPESFDKLDGLIETLKQPVENVNAAGEQLNDMANGKKSKRHRVLRR